MFKKDAQYHLSFELLRFCRANHCKHYCSVNGMLGTNMECKCKCFMFFSHKNGTLYDPENFYFKLENCELMIEVSLNDEVMKSISCARNYKGIQFLTPKG